MLKPKTEEEIELLRENGILVSKTLAEVGKAVAPGVTTKELNRVAETFIRSRQSVQVPCRQQTSSASVSVENIQKNNY